MEVECHEVRPLQAWVRRDSTPAQHLPRRLSPVQLPTGTAGDPPSLGRAPELPVVGRDPAEPEARLVVHEHEGVAHGIRLIASHSDVDRALEVRTAISDEGLVRL